MEKIQHYSDSQKQQQTTSNDLITLHHSQPLASKLLLIFDIIFSSHCRIETKFWDTDF